MYLEKGKDQVYSNELRQTPIVPMLLELLTSNLSSPSPICLLKFKINIAHHTYSSSCVIKRKLLTRGKNKEIKGKELDKRLKIIHSNAHCFPRL
jgi:hypothetical protein